VEIRRLRGADAAIWRGTRLEAHTTAPTAFGAVRADWGGGDRCGITPNGRRGGIFTPCSRRARLWRPRERSGRSTEHRRATLVAGPVRPDARGQGIVDRLFERICSEMPGDVLQIELEVANDNPAAITLYRGPGFEITARVPRAARHGDAFVDQLFMLRRLDA